MAGQDPGGPTGRVGAAQARHNRESRLRTSDTRVAVTCASVSSLLLLARAEARLGSLQCYPAHWSKSHRPSWPCRQSSSGAGAPHWLGRVRHPASGRRRLGQRMIEITLCQCRSTHPLHKGPWVPPDFRHCIIYALSSHCLCNISALLLHY